MKKLSRRDVLKSVGLTLGGLALSNQTHANNAEIIDLPIELTPPQYLPFAKPVTAITLGAGNRGNVYGGFSLAYADELDIVGVAEPVQSRRERYEKKHNIDPKYSFKTWEDVFLSPKIADAIIISMPDDLHYNACMKALATGYHVLLEKPIAQTEQECWKMRMGNSRRANTTSCARAWQVSPASS